jgi:hypothetical protein
VGEGLFEEGDGFAVVVLGAGEGLFDGVARSVRVGVGDASGLDSCVVASAAVMGRARGGS